MRSLPKWRICRRVRTRCWRTRFDKFTDACRASGGDLAVNLTVPDGEEAGHQYVAGQSCELVMVPKDRDIFACNKFQ